MVCFVKNKFIDYVDDSKRSPLTPTVINKITSNDHWKGVQAFLKPPNTLSGEYFAE